MASQTTYTCDRCGREDLRDVTSLESTTDAVFTSQIFGFRVPSMDLDLCSSCNKEFWERLKLWLASKPNQRPKPPPPPPPLHSNPPGGEIIDRSGRGRGRQF